MSQSHQQNSPTHQTPSQLADVKPFSIRQYVNASRHKNIFNSWPFPDKYLQMCLNLGLNLNDVLPPFGIGFQASSNLTIHSQNDSKVEVDQFCNTIEHQQNIKNEHDSLSHDAEGFTNKHIPSSFDYEEGNQPNFSASIINLSESADTTLPSSILDVQKKAMKDKQDRRGRKKCKKRSMVDILAVARHCTLEEIHRMNKFSYADQQMMPVENIYKSEAILGGRSEEDHEAANNGDMTEKGTLVLKFKLNGCNVNWNS